MWKAIDQAAGATGATGGVGRLAVQLAHAAGAHVSALVRDASAARELLHGLGADSVLEQIDADLDAIIDSVGEPPSGSRSNISLAAVSW
jgi:NADPH:quinone reductase